ncbi:ABC transporter substrate-binding protein [Paenibacillus sp. SC116]|uniref:ABC transporter substrate-binding protein n=1 Tax=Paenibacillus sp. SC116 TaxID=2968986 RepID=UPI00215B105A|nr:ABC transporter substrate-binding protein [Paenibacillus sp. SC116]MCR8844436.1 ABC transporter substrate-binding protein [Paenibacillus sp. SC116]
MKKSLLISFIGIAALTLAGCQSTDDSQKNKEVKNISSKAVTIVDGRGKEVVLEDGYAKNFVLFPNEGTEMFSITQSVEPFLGMRKSDQDSNIAGGVVAKYYPEILEVNSNIIDAEGDAPNVEEILKLNPDVVFQWSSAEAKIKPLEDVGIDVVALNWGTYKDDVERYTLYGQALGMQDRVEAVLAHHEKAKKAVLSVTEKLTEAERKNHVFVSHVNENQMNVWGTELPHTPVHKVENAAFTEGKITNKDADINAETLLQWDPDMIVIGEWAKEITPDYFYNHPVLKNLTAVKEKRVYKSPTSSLLDNPGISWYFYAVLSHPDKFEGFDMRKQVREDYKMLYNIDVTEEDIDQILNVAENKNSKSFELFMQ